MVNVRYLEYMEFILHYIGVVVVSFDLVCVVKYISTLIIFYKSNQILFILFSIVSEEKKSTSKMEANV